MRKRKAPQKGCLKKYKVFACLVPSFVYRQDGFELSVLYKN